MTGPIFLANESVTAAERTRVFIGGSSTGTGISMFSATLVDVWKRYIPDFNITVIPTPGTTAKYIPIDKGEMDPEGAASFGDYWAIHETYFSCRQAENIIGRGLHDEALRKGIYKIHPMFIGGRQ